MEQIDRAFRPQRLIDYIGQEDAKMALRIAIKAAKDRNEALDHLLFSGPPGLGKTSFANVVANELGAKMIVVCAPSIRTKGDMASILLNLEERDILFIDEIHSLDRKVEEILYPAMEDYKLSIVSGSGSNSSAVEIPIPQFTLIGATTNSGQLSAPLRDRFGDIVQMQFYSEDELSRIAVQTASKIGYGCGYLASKSLAKRSRGTPRVVNRLVRRARDFAQISGKKEIDLESVNEACSSIGIDEHGFDKTMRRYLQTILNRKSPIGIDTLSSLLGESKNSLEESVEPYLLRIGFIEKTGRGRIATQLAVSSFN